MKNLIILLIVSVFLSCENKEKLYKCENMKINVSFNHTDYYDSYTGLFKRKYWNETKTLKLELSKNEKNEINKILETNGFFDIQPQLEYNSYKIIPAHYMELNYSNSCITKKVRASYNIKKLFNSKKVEKFEKIIREIKNIIYEKQEVKKLPPSNLLIE